MEPLKEMIAQHRLEIITRKRNRLGYMPSYESRVLCSSVDHWYVLLPGS